MDRLNQSINAYLESCRAIQESPARALMRQRVTSLLVTKISQALPGLRLQLLHTGSLREGLGTGLGRPELFRKRRSSEVGVAFRHPLSSDVDLMLIATAAPVDGVLIKMTPVPGNPALVNIETTVAGLASLPEELQNVVKKKDSRSSAEAMLLTELLTVAVRHDGTATEVASEVQATLDLERVQRDTNDLRDHPEENSFTLLSLLTRFVMQVFLLKMSEVFLPPLLQCDVTHHGPAAEVRVLEFSPRLGYTTEYLADFLFSLPVTDWPESTLSFFTRERLWPAQEVIEDIFHSGCHIVPKGEVFEWRLSFSLAEIKLSDALPEAAKDTLRLAKSVFKMILSSHSTSNTSSTDTVDESPSSSLCSYHVKTCFFHMMETMPEDVWTTENILTRLLQLLEKLAKALKDKELHHLVLMEVNLFEGASSQSCAAISHQLMEMSRDQDRLGDILSSASKGFKAEQDYAYAHGEPLPQPVTAENRRLQSQAEEKMESLVENVTAVEDLSPIEPSTGSVPNLPFLTGRVIPNPDISAQSPLLKSMEPLNNLFYRWILSKSETVKRAPPLNPKRCCGFSRNCCFVTWVILFFVIAAISLGVPGGLGYFSRSTKPQMDLESAYTALHKVNNGRVRISTLFGDETTPCNPRNGISQQQCRSTPKYQAEEFSEWLVKKCVTLQIIGGDLVFPVRQHRNFNTYMYCRTTTTDPNFRFGLIATVALLEIQAYQDAEQKLRTIETQSVWEGKLANLKKRMTVRKQQVAVLASFVLANDATGAEDACSKIVKALNAEKHFFSQFEPLKRVAFDDVPTPIGGYTRSSSSSRSFSRSRSIASSRSRSSTSRSRSVRNSRSHSVRSSRSRSSFSSPRSVARSRAVRVPKIRFKFPRLWG